MSQIRFCTVTYLRNVRVYGDHLLQYSRYCNFDSQLTCIDRYSRTTFIAKRLFSSSANVDDAFTCPTNAKLKALKGKKEAKRIERLTRQRINELKRSVCILHALYLYLRQNSTYSAVVFCREFVIIGTEKG